MKGLLFVLLFYMLIGAAAGYWGDGRPQIALFILSLCAASWYLGRTSK